jgi:N-dimethylarginine dimethylaminohydrolase
MTGAPTRRRPRTRRYVMCPPTYFDVNYAINPWMNPDKPVDTSLAVAQWERLRHTLEDLGHRVDTLTPRPGLPDMVFVANGAVVVDGHAVVARFRHSQRGPESDAHLSWLRHNGFADAEMTTTVNEGEGDFLVTGRRILAGAGMRTDVEAHLDVQEALRRPVLSLHLTDPRYYHLDTALAVLDDEEIMYYPGAFSPASRGVLRDEFPDALLATAADAAVFGLNAVSDGRHVVLPEAATELAGALRDRGFEPIGVDMSELLKAGGSVKCCTLEIHGGDVGGASHE